MKKNIINTVRQLVNRFGARVHWILEKKGEHLEACGWYPIP